MYDKNQMQWFPDEEPKDQFYLVTKVQKFKVPAQDYEHAIELAQLDPNMWEIDGSVSYEADIF